ncbi:MAG: GDSL-type esterase/lipase family protein [bacterium]
MISQTHSRCACILMTFLAGLLIQSRQSAAAIGEKSAADKTTQTKAKATPKRNFADYYNQRCERMTADIAALPPSTTATIVMLGDSITEGFRARELSGLPVINMGISGDQIDMATTTGGVLRRAQIVKTAHPAHIFLLIGINDFGSSKPIVKAEAQYAALVKKLIADNPRAKLHLQSILPTRGRYAFHKPTIISMNDNIKRIAAENGADYIDLFAQVADEQGLLREDFTRDGLHLVPAGYEVWTRTVEERIK